MKHSNRKKALMFSLILLSGFLSSCNADNNKKSNINSLELSYSGPTRLIENSSVTFDFIINGTIDNENEFVYLFSDDESLVSIQNNVIQFASVDSDKEVVITLIDSDTKLTSSLSFTILDSGFTFADSTIIDENFSKKGGFCIDNENFLVNYDTEFNMPFLFETYLKAEKINDSDNKFGIVINDKNELDENSLLVSLTKNSSNQSAIQLSNYDVNSSSFSNIVYTKNLNFEIDTSSYFHFGIIKFDDGLKILLNNEDEEIHTLPFINYDFSSFTSSVIQLYGTNTKLHVKNTTNTYEFDEYIGRPTNIILDVNYDTTSINSTYQIDYKLEGEYSIDKIKFTSSDTSIATVDNSGLVTTSEKGGNVKISIQYRGTNLIRIFSLDIFRNADEEFKIDGLSNEHFFQTSIGENYQEFFGNENNTKLEIYGFKNTFGVYLYVKQFINDLKNNANEWWQKDNFEFRLATESKTSPQYWCSTLNDGSSNIPIATVTPLKYQSSATFDYNFNSEIFFSYDTLKQIFREDIDVTTKIGITFGVNDAYGWKCNDGFNTSDFTKIMTIKENGIF